jgi:lipopolysaccharide transport system ATP-binding protein
LLIDRGELLLQGEPKAVVAQYQRFINASPEGAAAIRKEIQTMRDSADVPATEPPAANVDAAAATGQPANANGGVSKPQAPAAQEDFFAPGLKSEATVYFEERGARIRDARLLALDGRRVNMLTLGRRYVIEYFIDFTESASDIGYGMGIRTVDGLTLAGASSVRFPALRIERVRPGQTVLVRIEFSCLMRPGPYFLSCGVTGIMDGERVVMHRIVDGLMVQVRPEADVPSFGIVDLSPSMKASIEVAAFEAAAPASPVV